MTQSGQRALPLTSAELAMRNAVQAAEIRDELNRHGTREEFKIPPEEEDDRRRMMHYIHCGRAQEIAQIDENVHGHLNVWGASQVINQDVRELPCIQIEAVLWAVWQFWEELHKKYPEQCENVLGTLQT